MVSELGQKRRRLFAFRPHPKSVDASTLHGVLRRVPLKGVPKGLLGCALCSHVLYLKPPQIPSVIFRQGPSVRCADRNDTGGVHEVHVILGSWVTSSPHRARERVAVMSCTHDQDLDTPPLACDNERVY